MDFPTPLWFGLGGFAEFAGSPPGQTTLSLWLWRLGPPPPAARSGQDRGRSKGRAQALPSLMNEFFRLVMAIISIILPPS